MGKVVHWKASELQAIRQYYGKMPNAELHKKYLPNRNVRAIELKALKLGLAKNQSDINWTEEETAILKSAPPDMTPAEIHEKLLPGRSIAAIAMRRNILKKPKEKPIPRTDPMRNQPRTPWTQEEIDLIRDHYRGSTVQDMQRLYLPNRSLHSIENMARILEESTTAWTPAEIKILKRHYQDMKQEDLQKRFFPNRTVYQIAHVAKAIGLKKKKTPWSPEELQILQKYHETKTAEELAAMLPGRTVMGIYKKCSRIGWDVPKDKAEN